MDKVALIALLLVTGCDADGDDLELMVFSDQAKLDEWKKWIGAGETDDEGSFSDDEGNAYNVWRLGNGEDADVRINGMLEDEPEPAEDELEDA